MDNLAAETERAAEH